MNPSIYICIRTCICMRICPSVYLSIYLSIYPSIYLCVHPSICPSFFLFSYLYISIFLSVSHELRIRNRTLRVACHLQDDPSCHTAADAAICAVFGLERFNYRPQTNSKASQEAPEATEEKGLGWTGRYGFFIRNGLKNPWATRDRKSVLYPKGCGGIVEIRTFVCLFHHVRSYCHMLHGVAYIMHNIMFVV